MNKAAFTIAAGCLLWALCGAAHAADPLIEAIEETLREPIRLVSEWESNNTLAFTMVAVVFLLGAVIAVIHSLPNPSIAKIGAVVLGSSVTLLTALNNAYFDFDHRQYKSMASQGRQLLAEIKASMVQLKEIPRDNKQGRDAMFEEIRKTRNAIMAIPASYKPRNAGEANHGDATRWIPEALVGTAHAMQGAPEWISKVPTDDENLYFVGYADGNDYASAKRASEERAYADARSFMSSKLSTPGGVDGTAAARYLLDSSRIASSYSYYDKQLNTFRFYTLVALSRKTADSDLRLYAGKTSQSATPAQRVAIQQAARSSNDYLSNRLATYSRELDRAQAQLKPAEYAQFSGARKLRQEGQARQAASELRAVTNARPDFYLGWFNLALALDEINDVAGAREAYERAVALEKKAAARDASLYNTYGYFLYRHREYSQAVTVLKTALEIAPDHPSARATLQLAQNGGNASRAVTEGPRPLEKCSATLAC
jgi:tetratricopeptide (TPR) repeat protein